MVAKTSSTPASDAAGTAARPQPWHQSPFHMKIACDACAVAILLGVVALYLVLPLA
jgi:hypothetical protein